MDVILRYLFFVSLCLWPVHLGLTTFNIRDLWRGTAVQADTYNLWIGIAALCYTLAYIYHR